LKNIFTLELESQLINVTYRKAGKINRLLPFTEGPTQEQTSYMKSSLQSSTHPSALYLSGKDARGTHSAAPNAFTGLGKNTY